MPTLPNDYKPKSFWNRPEGFTGMIVLAAAGVILVATGAFNWLLANVLTFFTLLTKTFTAAISAAIMGTALAVLLMIIFNPKVQTLVRYMFKSVMRFLTAWFVEIDPIGIMRGYIDDLKKKLNELRESKQALSGQVTVCENKINRNKAEADKALKMVAAARDMALKAQAARDEERFNNAQAQMGLNSNQNGRLMALNARLEPTLAKMQMLQRVLSKYEFAASNAIVDITNEVDARSQERDMIRSSHSAMKKAMSIVRGAGPQYDLFMQAMEYTAEEYGKKLGEITDFMDQTKGIIEGIDLQNGVWQQEALDKLEAFEKAPDSLLLGGEKRLMIESASAHSIPAQLPSAESVKVEAGSVGEYDAIFSKVRRS